MFDKLVEFIISVLHIFRCWSVVREGEVTVIYFLGQPRRVVHHNDGIRGTGIHAKWPLYIESDEETSVREEWVTLETQSLTTSDGKRVYVQGTFRLQVLPDKVVVFQVSLGDEDRTERNTLRAAIAETVERHTYSELIEIDEAKGIKQEILTRARKDLNDYGYKVYEFRWLQKVEARAYRLITGY